MCATAEAVYLMLRILGIKSSALHSRETQAKRNAAVNRFKAHSIRYLAVGLTEYQETLVLTTSIQSIGYLWLQMWPAEVWISPMLLL